MLWKMCARQRPHHCFMFLEQHPFKLKGKASVLQIFNSEAICALFSSVQVEELLKNQTGPEHFGKQLESSKLSKINTK